jgi:hypothetical protein
LRVKRWKKANIHKRYVRNFTLHWQSSRWKACKAHFQQTYVNGVWLWIESYIREFRESKIYDIFTFLPCSYPLLCGFPTCWHPLLIPKVSRNAYLSRDVPLWIYTVLLMYCFALYVCLFLPTCITIRQNILWQKAYKHLQITDKHTKQSIT